MYIFCCRLFDERFFGVSYYSQEVLFLMLCFQAVLAATVEIIRDLILWKGYLSLFNNVYDSVGVFDSKVLGWQLSVLA